MNLNQGWHVQLANPPPPSTCIPYGYPFLAALLPIQLTAWENSRGWPKLLGPCIFKGDPGEAPGTWLQISSVLDTALAELTSE